MSFVIASVIAVFSFFIILYGAFVGERFIKEEISNPGIAVEIALAGAIIIGILFWGVILRG